jgi:putative oxidoreductase
VQRLFTTFANEWPGFGLLVQRLLIGITLICPTIAMLNRSPSPAHIALHIVGAIFGLLILLGFWTPIAGALSAAVELWIAFATDGDPWVPILLAVFSGTLAIIGPGAWSVDAWLFGRKRIPT